MKVNPGEFGECIKNISDRGKISKDDALDIINQVATRAEKMRSSGVKDPLVAAADELATKLKESVARDRTDTLNNAMKRNGWMDRIEAEGGAKMAFDSVQGQLSSSNVAGALSIQARQRSYWRDWAARLDKNLRAQPGLYKIARSGKLSLQIARELWELNAGRSAINPGSPEYKIASEIHARLDEVRTRLNAAGARIGDALDYVMRTEHNPVKMRRAAGWFKTYEEARDAWTAKTEPRLDQSTFDMVDRKDNETPADARKRFLHSVFDALYTGVHKTVKGQTSDTPYFEGSANLAKRLSEGKVLKWKDADAWHAHMAEFGQSPSLVHAVYRAFENGGKALGLMESLGSNPRDNFNRLMRMIEEKYRSSDPEAIERFKNRQLYKLQNQMDVLDGTANKPANNQAAQLLRLARSYTSLTSLGGVLLTHAGTLPVSFPSEMSLHGVSRFTATKHLIETLFRGRGSAERQEMLAQIGAFSNSLARSVTHDWGMQGDLPGLMSSLSNSFFNMTGIHWLFDRGQAAGNDMMANYLALNVGKSFDQLEPHVQQMLGKFYKFTPAEWDLMRKHGVLTEADGLKYLTQKATKELDPDAVERHLRAQNMLPPDASADTIKKMVDRLRFDLTDKLGAYYADTAAHVVVTPGARERALSANAGKPGSFSRELMDNVMQFKLWPLAAATQLWGRQLHMNLSKKNAGFGIGYLFAASTMYGMIKLWGQDLANNRPLRDPSDWRTWASSFIAGGGGGIYADYVFGEVNRMGNNALEQAAGPVAGSAFQFWHMAKEFLHEEFSKDPNIQERAWKNLWPNLAHWAIRQVPYANLFYFKGALNYMLFYHMLEAAHPGWWERTNQKLIKEQGRPLSGYEPGHGVPWTPWAIGYPTYDPHPASSEPSEPSGGGGVAQPTF